MTENQIRISQAQVTGLETRLQNIENSGGGTGITFTATENGLVPAPGSVSGKVLSDNGTWVDFPTGGGGGGDGTWGSITGNLSDQTDLQNALTSKAPTNNPTFTGQTIFTQNGTSPGVVIRDSAESGGYAMAYMAFQGGDGVNTGFVGDASGTPEPNITLYSSGGVVTLRPNGSAVLTASSSNVTIAGTLTSNGAITQGGNQVWHAGNLTLFNSSTPGYVPASGGGTDKFLRADGTWAEPISGDPSNLILEGTGSTRIDFNSDTDGSPGSAYIERTQGSLFILDAGGLLSLRGSSLSFSENGSAPYGLEIGGTVAKLRKQAITLQGNVSTQADGAAAGNLAVAGTLTVTGKTALGDTIAFSAYTEAGRPTAADAGAGGVYYQIDGVKGLYISDGTNYKHVGDQGLTYGTVTNVSTTVSDGVTATVSNPTTTPEIALGLGDITPDSVDASGNIKGANGLFTGGSVQAATGYFTSSVIAPNLVSGFMYSMSGTAKANEILTIGIAPYGFVIDAAKCGAESFIAASSNNNNFTLKKRRGGTTTTLGTFSWGNGWTAASVNILQTAVNAGDYLYIQAPASPDSTLADIGFTIRG